MAQGPIQLLKPTSAATAPRHGHPRGAGSRAPARLVQALRAAFISASEAAAIRHALIGATPSANWMSLLPEGIKIKVLASRHEALMKMLLAWGESLREQAALAAKAHQKRRVLSQQRKQQAENHALLAQDLRRQPGLERLRSKASSSVSSATKLDSGPIFDSREGGINTSGLNRPILEALAAPLPMGVSLRTATLRLSSQYA